MGGAGTNGGGATAFAFDEEQSAGLGAGRFFGRKFFGGIELCLMAVGTGRDMVVKPEACT